MGMAVRKDMAGAQARAWAEIGRPGTWLTAAERVAVAAEARHAQGCPLCAARKAALSPAMVGGDHASLGALGAAETEAVHRIVSDSGRIGKAWFERLGAAGLGDERYVELVSIVAVTICIDTFRAAAGLEAWPLPAPAPGAPTRRRPAKVTEGIAWVPVLLPEDRGAEDPDLYLDGGGGAAAAREGQYLFRAEPGAAGDDALVGFAGADVSDGAADGRL